MELLTNIGAAGVASQSSYSKWSKPDEASRALNGQEYSKFAFHTDDTGQPWWMVDLGDVYPIHSIIVGNRADRCKYRARTLCVEVSRDGTIWVLIHRGFMHWQSDHTFPLGNEIIARFVRLSLEEDQHLHLRKIEIWSLRSPVTVVSNRNDGLGCRLESLIRARYLAKVLNANHKVRWQDHIKGPSANFNDEQKISGNAVLGHAIESCEMLFTDNYIKEHFETGHLSNTTKLSRIDSATAEELHTPSAQNEDGILYACGGYSDLSLSPYLAPDKSFGLSNVFWNIPFRSNIRAAMDAALDIELIKKSAALHIRSGDIVYGEYRKQGRRFRKKAVSIPLAQMALKKLLTENYSVVVFGEDTGSLETLQTEFPEIRLATDLNAVQFSGLERAMFDIVLMSRMNKVWAGYSGFARFAKDIGEKVELSNVHTLFKRSEMVSFFEEAIPLSEDRYHKMQTVFSLWNLFCIHSDENINRKIEILDRLDRLDPENKLYIIEKACLLLRHGMLKEASRILEKNLYENWNNKLPWGGTESSKIILALSPAGRHLRETFEGITDISSNGDANIELFQAMIKSNAKDYIALKGFPEDLF